MSADSATPPSRAELHQSVLEQCEREQLRFISLQFTDIVGIVKSVTIPVHRLADSFDHGTWFDGSSIEGFARIAESDMYLDPDPATFALMPWEGGSEKTARLICDVYTPEGNPFPGDPRYVLRRALDEAAEMGYVFNTGPELEFFLLQLDDAGNVLTTPHDEGGYFDLSTDLAAQVRRDMVVALEAMGMSVEASHHEVATGQHEIDFQYDNALRTADNAVTFRYTLKAIARKAGLYAAFMPKPRYGINGSGMHTHQSLADIHSGDNLFFDPSGPYGLSELARHFIAGVLTHARGICAVLAPLVNSYKRLVPGYEAPVYVSWAHTNRSALIRVPKVIPNRPQSSRIELRCPDPSCNPYLAFAVMLHAGLDGIRRELEPPPPLEENLYEFDQTRLQREQVAQLPGSLGDALDAFGASSLVQEALGVHIFERFMQAKRQEHSEYRQQVTQWELDRYLEIY
ncbi:MAG: type I glutamate--ammonia ligase [Dehalococcoidia bacterium]|nr:type I glutamate--ammonia ligase [Dehalococcoidia bacterium]